MKTADPLSERPSPAVIAALRSVGGLVGKAAWRIRFTNKHNIPQKRRGGLVIASNHQTYLDPYWIALPVNRQMRFMAWDRAFNWFLIGPAIKKLGAFPVDIEKGSISSMKEAKRVLEAGNTLVVFPEGSRAQPDGKLLDFREGAARLAISSGVPILPVTIKGGNRVWPRGKKMPRPGRVEVTYHPLIETESFMPGESTRSRAATLTQNLRNVIGSAL